MPAYDTLSEAVNDLQRRGYVDQLTLAENCVVCDAHGLTLDPEVFVLGGGLAAGSDLYLDPIRRWFGELLYQPHLRPVPRIEFARWGPLAGAVGAALLPELAP